MIWIIIFGILCGGIGAMIVVEAIRYNRQSGGDSEFAYPRARLIRRSGIGVLLACVIAGALFKPSAYAPATSLAWYGLCLIGVIAIMWLTLRDLHETSRTVVADHQDFQRDMAKQIRETLPESQRKALRSEKKDGRGGRIS